MGGGAGGALIHYRIDLRSQIHTQKLYIKSAKAFIKAYEEIYVDIQRYSAHPQCDHGSYTCGASERVVARGLIHNTSNNWITSYCTHRVVYNCRRIQTLYTELLTFARHCKTHIFNCKTNVKTCTHIFFIQL